MLYRACFVASLMLIAGQAKGDEESWVLHGRVFDQQHQPVADVEIATFWNANGVRLEESLRLQKEAGDDTKSSINEGRMEPLGRRPTKTDANGKFSMRLEPDDYKVLAIDNERKRGALIFFNPNNAPSSVDVELVPLVRLHGRVRIASTKEYPESTIAVVRLPTSEECPFGGRVAMCSSLKSRFEFWLPPGNYLLEAGGPLHRLAPYRPVTLAVDQRDADSGILELTPEPPAVQDRINDANAKGTWIDYTKRFGQPAPLWHAVDASGIRKDAQLSDFKGKWVLLYFWGPSCAPCLGKTLPALMEFYAAHEGQRDRFEIVTVCVAPDGWKTMADLDEELKPIVKAVWRGKKLPFPVVLDDTFKTLDNFGLGHVGQLLLVDPTGNLIQGDEKNLAEKLKAAAQFDPKR